MRIGFTGSVEAHDGKLAEIVPFLLDTIGVSQVVSLTPDGKLRQYAEERYGELSHKYPGSSTWDRSIKYATQGAEEIDACLEVERARSRIDRLTSLDSCEVLALKFPAGGSAAVCHDWTEIDRATLSSHSVLVFGADPNPLVKQVGGQLWLCPGSLSRAGLMVLDGNAAGLQVRLYDRHCIQVAAHDLMTTTNEPSA